MSPLAILALGLAAKIGLFLSGLAVYLCFILLIGGAVIHLFGPAGFGMIANSMYAVTTTEALTTVPLYVLMGEILLRSGSIDALFKQIDKLVGGIRGRQFHMALILSAILGAPAGSGIAVAAMLGRSVMRPMLARGYDPQLTAGVMMGGALLAPIIPPSVLAIIIGTIADVSIADLLISGIIPGIVLTGFYVAVVAFRVWRNPALAPQEVYVRPSGREKLEALARMIPFTLIIVVAVGLIMVDFATASEAAALGVLAALIELILVPQDELARLSARRRRVRHAVRRDPHHHRDCNPARPGAGLHRHRAGARERHRKAQRRPLALVLRPDAAAVRALHLRRPDRDHDDPDPDLRSAHQGDRLRTGMVLDAVSDHHGGRLDHPAVRLHHLRAEGRGA